MSEKGENRDTNIALQLELEAKEWMGDSGGEDFDFNSNLDF